MVARILLVDDNLDHVQLALRALKESPDWTVDVARTGLEAQRKLKDATFDLVILDYRLPDTTGLAMLETLRADKGPAVLLMTSQGSEEVAERALEAGALNYVVKDASFGRRLVYEVREWFESRAEG